MPPKDSYRGLHFLRRNLHGDPARTYPVQKRYIERVLYNAPATIIFWSDGEKTVVKCHECPMSGKCEHFRKEDGACGYQDHAIAWRRMGVINASLKRTFPNYIDQLSKVFGE